MNSAKPKILVIDDEPRMVEVLTLMLEDAEYRVSAAFSGKEGLRTAYIEHPDLILLDIMMPEMDGFQVLDTLRLVTDIPIIMLTAAVQDPNRVRGMDKGATDFITKGTSTEVLLAHIRARLRPASKWKAQGIRHFGDDLVVDVTKRAVRVDDKPVTLTSLQWRLFQCLLEHEGSVSSYDDLLSAGWDNPEFRTPGAIKVQISLLREKLHDQARPSRFIHTIREEGYMFEVR
ncbi:MAG: response regulator transcription factor [Chloroflexi bacterium]|nr:response regulator transcription factor [Chloroflexota bacterium]